jgi:hypothetical protein
MIHNLIEGTKEGLGVLGQIPLLLTPLAVFVLCVFLLASVLFNEAVRYVGLIW